MTVSLPITYTYAQTAPQTTMIVQVPSNVGVGNSFGIELKIMYSVPNLTYSMFASVLIQKNNESSPYPVASTFSSITCLSSSMNFRNAVLTYSSAECNGISLTQLSGTVIVVFTVIAPPSPAELYIAPTTGLIPPYHPSTPIVFPQPVAVTSPMPVTITVA
ncbi:MAG: hypothetical protein ACLPY5_05670 [Candidatus Bathyarchaeia archaeon]